MPLLRRNDGPALYYELDDYTDPWKDAPYILLQHGFSRSSKFWYRAVPYLSRHYRIIRPDLRGLGQSSTDFDVERGISIAAYIDDLNAVLDALGLKSVHYCGESFGGILGIAFAAECPERVRTLTAISVPMFRNEEVKTRACFGYASWEEALRKLGARGYAEAKNKADRFAPDTDPALTAWFSEEYGKSDVDVLIGMSKLATSHVSTTYLPRIKAPTLIINPSHDTHTTPEHEALLRRHAPHARLVHLPSHFHNLHFAQPVACASHLLHFCAQCDGIACHE